MSAQTGGALYPEGRFYFESAAHLAGRGSFQRCGFHGILLDQDSAEAAAAGAPGFAIEDPAVAFAVGRLPSGGRFLLPHRIDFDSDGGQRRAGRIVPLDGARSGRSRARRYVGPLHHGFQRMQRFSMLPDGGEGTLTGRECARIPEGTASVASSESAPSVGRELCSDYGRLIRQRTLNGWMQIRTGT